MTKETEKHIASQVKATITRREKTRSTREIKNAVTRVAIDGLIKERRKEIRQSVPGGHVDRLGRQIRKLLKANYDVLDADYVIETLTHLGEAPNVMYDDNGLFAVSGDGYQPVVTGRERIDGAITVVVRKRWWHRSIREALQDYLARR